MPAYSPKAFEDYLDSLALGGPLKDLVRNCLNEFRFFMGGDPEYVLLEDFVDGNGKRNVTDIGLFIRHVYYNYSIIENRFFINDINRKYMGFNFVQYKNITGGEVNPESIIVVQITIAGDLQLALRATGLNCANVIEVMRKYFFPNIGRL